MPFWVYIMASRKHGPLHVDVTSDLVRRAYEHREALIDSFTRRHGVKMLVYFESYDRAIDAIQREKNMKHWPRAWKLNLIRAFNPDWRDLFEEVAS